MLACKKISQPKLHSTIQGGFFSSRCSLQADHHKQIPTCELKHNSVVGIAPYVVHSTPGKRYLDFRPDCVVTRLGERLCNFVKPQVKRVQAATSKTRFGVSSARTLNVKLIHIKHRYHRNHGRRKRKCKRIDCKRVHHP